MKFTFSKFFKVLAITSDIITVGLFLNYLLSSNEIHMKNVLDNPITNLMFLALLITLNIFLVPLFLHKIKFNTSSDSKIIEPSVKSNNSVEIKPEKVNHRKIETKPQNEMSKPNVVIKVSGTGNQVANDHSTIINHEKVFHPTDDLIGRIRESLISKSSPLYIKYENVQGIKNRAFALEIIRILEKQGYSNIKLDDGMYQWGRVSKDVDIYKSGDNLMLFVDMY